MTTNRTPFVAANWKMNGTGEFCAQYFKSFHANTQIAPLLANDATTQDKAVEVLFAVPFVFIEAVRRLLLATHSPFHVAAQNVAAAEAGAFTGEVSAKMLEDLGVAWTIIGHSERRTLFGDDDETVFGKVQAALRHSLSVILCVGETLEERRAEATEAVVERQLGKFLHAAADGTLLPNDASSPIGTRIVIAYEPVWAIGTGVTPTEGQIAAAHAHIRRLCVKHLGGTAGGSVRLLYGGSVTAANCRSIAPIAEVDGFLVGGASLKADDFASIVHSKLELVPKPK